MTKTIRVGFALLLLVILFPLPGFSAERNQSGRQPALTLRDPTAEEMEVSGWRAGRPLSNSVRAWHYNLDLVKPLLEVGDAVDECELPLEMRLMLAGVVASRNHCLY
ncbi:MAG: hypothetical protein JSW58_04955 [Candidatus Latescibacterota bacterium]|nr:MAG: hypothetical protein JSW58_04955 [Candidatus Latescibacterota bacterium]